MITQSYMLFKIIFMVVKNNWEFMDFSKVNPINRRRLDHQPSILATQIKHFFGFTPNFMHALSSLFMSYNL
jgi:hypothetical protein